MPCSFLNPSIPPYLSTSVCDSCGPPSLLSIYPYCHFTPFSSLHPPLHSSLTFAPGPSLLPPPSASEPFPSLYWLRTASRWRARQQCRALPPGKHGKKSPKTLRRCVHCRVSRVTQKLDVRAPTHSQALIYMQVFITQLARRAALLNDDFLVTQFIPSSFKYSTAKEWRGRGGWGLLACLWQRAVIAVVRRHASCKGLPNLAVEGAHAGADLGGPLPAMLQTSLDQVSACVLPSVSVYVSIWVYFRCSNTTDESVKYSCLHSGGNQVGRVALVGVSCLELAAAPDQYDS